MLKRPLRPDLRKDGVRERLPDLHKGTSHSAYAWLRRVKEGQLPSKRLNIRKALDAVEGGGDLPKASIYVCPVCGNTVENDVPDICPVCNVSGDKFTEVA